MRMRRSNNDGANGIRVIKCPDTINKTVQLNDRGLRTLVNFYSQHEKNDFLVPWN